MMTPTIHLNGTSGDRIVGYVNSLGYLICVECLDGEIPQYDKHGPFPVRADSLPHSVEPCDRCKEILNA